MLDLLGLQDYLPYVKWAALLIGISLVLIAVAAITYVLKTTYAPLFLALRWIVGLGHREEPGEIARGIGYGARMVLWAVVIGFFGWFFWH
jgi:hypothetical protein